VSLPAKVSINSKNIAYDLIGLYCSDFLPNHSILASAVLNRLLKSNVGSAITSPAVTDPNTATPTFADYEVMLKGAITRAMTANPGGAKATVNCPLDQDPMVGYNPANKVYWKDFQVA